MSQSLLHSIADTSRDLRRPSPVPTGPLPPVPGLRDAAAPGPEIRPPPPLRRPVVPAHSTRTYRTT